MMTLEQIKGGTGSSADSASKFMAFINETCEKYDISTPIRQLCFLSQLGHESAGLFYTEELASGKAYEGRKDLGNIYPGDGVKFKGRGLIQITGRNNYKIIGTALGIDLISNPTLLGGKNAHECNAEQLKNAAISAGWFWNSRKLNDIADQIDIKTPLLNENLSKFISITKKINGGTNGLQDRINKYRAGVKFFITA